eukprot:s459_g3.t1
MIYQRVALSLSFVVLLRLARFPCPVLEPQDVLRSLWESSILFLDDCHFHFCRSNEPDIRWVLDSFLSSPGQIDWSRVPLLTSGLCRLFKVHFALRTLPPVLSGILWVLFRRLLRVTPVVTPDSVDRSMQAMTGDDAALQDATLTRLSAKWYETRVKPKQNKKRTAEILYDRTGHSDWANVPRPFNGFTRSSFPWPSPMPGSSETKMWFYERQEGFRYGGCPEHPSRSLQPRLITSPGPWQGSIRLCCTGLNEYNVSGWRLCLVSFPLDVKHLSTMPRALREEYQSLKASFLRGSS